MKARSAKLYKIQEVAQKTKLTERTLRFYESEGLLKIYHTPGGMRLYTPTNLKQISEIKKLVTKHKIANVKKMIAAEPDKQVILFIDPTVSPEFNDFENSAIKTLAIKENPIDFDSLQKIIWKLIEEGHSQFYFLCPSPKLSKNFGLLSEWQKEAKDFEIKLIDSQKMGLCFLNWLEKIKLKEAKNENKLDFDLLKNYQEYFYIPKLSLKSDLDIAFEFSPLLQFDGQMKALNRDLSWEGFLIWIQDSEQKGLKIEIFSDNPQVSLLQQYPIHRLSEVHKTHLGEQAIGIVLSGSEPK